MRPNVERRSNKIRFSKEINLGNIIALIAIMIQFGIVVNKVNQVIFKVNLMWDDYNKRVINAEKTNTPYPGFINTK